MADQKVSNLPALNGADVDSADLLYIVDSSAGTAGSKKITIGQYQLAPVSGGTANGVTYLNGSKVLTSGSALTFDGTNLGVGTSSPGAKLDVNGNARLSNGTGFTTANSLVRQLESVAGAANQFTIGSIGFFTGAFSDNGQIVFSTNSGSGNTERMRLDSSGNLGLGVTPSAISGGRYLQFLSTSSVGQQANGTANLMNNAYESSGNNFSYIVSAGAARYNVQAGVHAWFTAPSGTAGNAITFTQAMTLDASGNLGVGTTSPGARLDVAHGTTAGQITSWFTKGSSDPNFRLGFSNGSGSAVNTEQAALVFAYTGVDVLAKIGFLRGSTSDSNGITFSVGGTGGGTERARITSGGDLLVGTTDASVGSGTGLKLITTSGVAAARMQIGDSGSTDSNIGYSMYSTGAGAYRFYVGYGGTIFATSTTITAISDQRLKENVQDLDVGLDKIMALKPRKFDWKPGKGKDIKGDRGWIAQEFEQVFPDMVDQWIDPAPEGEGPYKAVRADLIPVLVKAIQEQQAIITDLRARVAALEAK